MVKNIPMEKENHGFGRRFSKRIKFLNKMIKLFALAGESMKRGVPR